jgi:hypothetical protein
MADFAGAWVYHEPQDASLCGVHALNTLLQGPYFTAVDLAGKKLDSAPREACLMLVVMRHLSDWQRSLLIWTDARRTSCSRPG